MWSDHLDGLFRGLFEWLIHRFGDWYMKNRRTFLYTVTILVTGALTFVANRDLILTRS